MKRRQLYLGAGKLHGPKEIRDFAVEPDAHKSSGRRRRRRGGVERSRINNNKTTEDVEDEEDVGDVEKVVKKLNIRKQRKNRIVNSVEEKVEYVRPNRRRLIGGVINIHSNERL